MSAWLAKILLLFAFALLWGHNLVEHVHANEHETVHHHTDNPHHDDHDSFLFGPLDHVFTQSHFEFQLPQHFITDYFPGAFPSFNLVATSRPTLVKVVHYNPPESPPRGHSRRSFGLRGPPIC